MDFKKIIARFILAFAVSLLVCMGVTILWSLVFHGAAIIDWETSFRYATLLGIILTIIGSAKRMKSEN